MMSVDIKEELEKESWEERKQRLDKARDQAVEEFTESQKRAIESLSSAAKSNETEWVDVFGEEFEVKTDLPGDVALRANRLLDQGGVEAVEGICDVLEVVSVKEDLTADVWFEIFRQCDMTAFIDVAEQLLNPAMSKMENRQESISNVDGFRQK